MKSDHWATDTLDLPVRDERDYVVNEGKFVKSVSRRGKNDKNPGPHHLNVGMIRVQNRIVHKSRP